MKAKFFVRSSVNGISRLLICLGISQLALAQEAVVPKEHPSPSIVRGFMMKDTFDQKECNDVREWGANVIRIQTSPAQFASSHHKKLWEVWPLFLDQLESQVEQAKQASLKVVVDMHNPPVENATRTDQAEFWERKDLEQSFCKAWTDIATRLLPYKEVIWGYDILNEPLDRSQLPGVTKQWRPLAIKIVEAIRKVDADTWVVFEPGPGSLFSGFKELVPLPDPHIIYSSHFYYPQDFTHQGVANIKGTDLAEAKKKINLHYPSVINGSEWNKQRLEKMLKDADEFQAKYNVPIYVGEFSVIRWAPKDSSARWLQDVVDLFEARHWSWSYHAFREWNGWSLEHDEEFWKEGMPPAKAVPYETQRAKIIKKAFLNN